MNFKTIVGVASLISGIGGAVTEFIKDKTLDEKVAAEVAKRVAEQVPIEVAKYLASQNHK